MMRPVRSCIRYGHFMQTATEFAAGRGHPEYPLLSARYSPASRVACTDFSPWLRARLAEGDTDAAVLYLLQIIQANPGTGVSTGATGGNVAMLDSGDETWMRIWTDTAREVLDVPFTDLRCSTAGWELDLRTILVMMQPKGSALSVLSMGAEEGREGNAATLAAAMVCHDVHLDDPEVVVRVANAKLRAWRKFAPVEWITEATLAAVSPPPAREVPPVLGELPLATRSHLYDISGRPNRSAVFASKFSSFYRTRTIGCDDEESLALLVRHGLIRVVDDEESAFQASAQVLTIAQLHELLRDANLPTPPARTKKADVVVAARAIKADVIAATADQGPVCELTRDGERTIAWVKDRVNDTRAMWGAWAARHQPSRLSY